ATSSGRVPDRGDEGARRRAPHARHDHSSRLSPLASWQQVNSVMPASFQPASVLGRRPAYLELKFLNAVPSLMLDAELGSARNAKPLVGNLDIERTTLLEGIRETTQLGDELRTRVGPLEIAIGTCSH